MKTFFCTAALLLLIAGTVQAQGPANQLRRDANPAANPAPAEAEAPRGPTMSPGTIQPTPEMWFYEQERLRYQDPHDAVRRKAEFRSSQRANRMASMKWFGMSNSRPVAMPTPVTGTYSPMWVGNTNNPSQWRSGAGPVVVVQRPSSSY